MRIADSVCATPRPPSPGRIRWERAAPDRMPFVDNPHPLTHVAPPGKAAGGGRAPGGPFPWRHPMGREPRDPPPSRGKFPCSHRDSSFLEWFRRESGIHRTERRTASATPWQQWWRRAVRLTNGGPMSRPARPLLPVLAALLVGAVLPAVAADHLIADFDDPKDVRGLQWDADTIDATFGPRAVTERGSVLKFVAKRGDYPGLFFYEPRVPRDWSAHEALSFVVWSNDERDIAIRIDDHKSAGFNSRFNGGTRLLKGRNLVQVPTAVIGKAIDLKTIKSMTLFLDHPPANLTLWFDDIKLGRLESEKVPFIPYQERMDHQPSMEVVSPHLD